MVASTPVPLSLANCVLWLTADRITGLANNDPVATWSDVSGVGNHFTQGTSGRRPLYKVNQRNGYPGVYFDNSDDTLTGSLSIASPYTIFVVYASNAGAGGGHRVLQGATNNWLMGPYNALFNFYNGGFITGAASGAGVYKCQHVVGDGAGAQMFVNNASAGTNGNTTGPGTLVIGCLGAFAESADSTVLEIIVYSDKKSVADQAIIYNYLKDKYAL